MTPDTDDLLAILLAAAVAKAIRELGSVPSGHLYARLIGCAPAHLDWSRGAAMKQPSNKAMNDWIRAQPRGNYTCSDCGKVGPDYEVQPQHPFYADGRDGVARCVPCINAINRRMAAKRKAELAKMARCELCNRRGTFVTARQVLLCGHHLKQAQRQHQRSMGSMGGMGLFMRAEYSREDILRMVKGA